MKTAKLLILAAIMLLPASTAMAYTPGKVYYIHSSDISIKSRLSISHDFGSMFSSELSESDVNLLKSKGIQLEEVKIRTVDDELSGVYCLGMCGKKVEKPFNGKSSCYCDIKCIAYKDCCPDACQYCGFNCGITTTTVRPGTTTTVKTTTTTIKPATSTTTYKTTTTMPAKTTTTYITTTTYYQDAYCAGKCQGTVYKPYNGKSSCSCSSLCKLLGNCCPDVCQYCGFSCGTTTTTFKSTTTTYKPTTTTFKATTTTYKPTTTTFKSTTTTAKTTTTVKYTTTTMPSRTCYPSSQKQWGVSMVNGGSGGAGVTVAILDTGIDTDHPDLKANIKTCISKVTHNSQDSVSCEDAHGHGTHVAGIVAANGGSDNRGIYGVAPQANLMIIKVCDRNGNCYADDVAAGIMYAADNGANIISISISGNGLDSGEKSAIDYATGKGVLVVAAAGNKGPDYNTIQYPGAYYKVVSVAATDSTKSPASFSSRGVNDGDYVREEREIELAAPGVSIVSAFNNGCYTTKSGTSMATPHIAGLAAKLWKGSASSTRSYLKSIAKDIWTYGDDTATGFGLPIAP